MTDGSDDSLHSDYVDSEEWRFQNWQRMFLKIDFSDEWCF